MTTWFTSDTHFGHKNIIKFQNRPFASIKEMDETLIANWNALIQPEDTVYHLGDFAYRCTPEYARECFDRLNGIKHLIEGNHDKLALNFSRVNGWASITPQREIRIEGARIVLNHYSMRAWHHDYQGVGHLFGHSHGGLEPFGRSFDVGVDCWDYKPIDLLTVCRKLNSLDYRKTRGIPQDQLWDKSEEQG